LRIAELEHHHREAERERVRLETELAQAQRLESLGRLTSGIAHDFNNLLGVVSNYATFVARAIGPDSPVADDVAAIQRSAQQAAALTRELLLFSQGQVGRVEPFDLGRLVTDVVTLLRRPFGQDITLVAAPGNELSRVVGERGQVEQLVVNLLLNARDAVEGSGTISVTTSNVLVGEPANGSIGDAATTAPDDELAPGRYVVLSVVDDGAGMDTEVLARAFEPFFSTKGREHGTGLGLATVRGIAARAGGGVTLDSAPGVGTTARVFLPAAEEVDDDAPTPPRSGGSETILLVDDDADVRGLSRRILRDAGYDVIEAATPRDAITLAATANAALLLTDIAMPDIDGLELASRLCAEHPHLKVAFVSATVRDLGPDARSSVLVDKPFDADELLFAVRRALDAQPDDALPG
jgi:nitrogen-specific signal transduction histidine kinase